MLQFASFTFSPIQENTYLLYNEHHSAILIDPGCYSPAEQKLLADFITAHRLEVKYILLTHAHLDHVFGLKWAADTFGLTPHCTEAELPMLAMAEASGENWGLPFVGYHGPVQTLYNRQILTLDADELVVLSTPGHSPGHVCFHNAVQNFLIAGDALFKESIGRTDLPGGNHEELLHSIHSRLLCLADETTVHSGHGDSTTIGHEKAHNPFLQ